ncbi:MAG: RNA polymerase-binding protein DksA [Syntrophobacteraceae bacterium]|nr:RNA polymerase-binding protein DksA [Syntrophobacteraceae bacterium]
MNPRQLDYFRRRLLDWRKDLVEASQGTLSKMNQATNIHPDPVDRAMQEADTALELRTRDRYRKLLRKIEDALERIQDGTYGYCEETGDPIGVKRLEARPVATLSLEAQARREKAEKQGPSR